MPEQYQETYTASEALITQLKEDGFVETTAKYYPEHTERLQGMALYDPNKVKRTFSHPATAKNHCYVYFNYSRIYMALHDSVMIPFGDSLTRRDLNYIVSTLQTKLRRKARL